MKSEKAVIDFIVVLRIEESFLCFIFYKNNW